MLTTKQEAHRKILEDQLAEIYENDTVKPVYTPPFTLGKEIVDGLPSVDGKILVLSDLGLLISLWQRLKSEGKGLDQVMFVAHTPEQELFAQDLVTKVINVGYNDPIKEMEKALMGMKFDIIVGNPPYQGVGKDSAQKLWKHFVISVEDILNPMGYYSLVIPSSWGKPLGHRPVSLNKNLYAAIFEHSILHTDFTASKFFPNVGIDISWLMVHKNRIASHPHGYYVRSEIAGEILKKVIEHGDTIPSYITDAQTAYKQGTTKVKSKSEIYKYPVLDVNTSWTDVYDPIFDQPKIVFPRNFGYVALEDSKGEFAVGQQAYALALCPTELAMTWFNSKLMRYIMTHCAWTPQLDFALLNIVPSPDLTKSWNDSEIYKHYQLSEKQISEIEKQITSKPRAQNWK